MTKTQKQYSPWLQLLILIGLYIGFIILDTIIGSIISNNIAGYGILELRKADPFLPKVRTVYRIFSFTDLVIIFVIPSLILISRMSPKTPLNLNFQWRQLLVILLIFFAGIPLYYVLNDWNQTWNLKPRSENDILILKALMEMPDVRTLLLNLFLFAIMPPIAYGLFFRVVLQRLLIKIIPRAPWIAIIITAVIFSASFFSMRDFMAWCFLGLQVGAIFYITGNFWLSVISNVLINFVSIVWTYLFQAGVTRYNPEDPTHLGWYWAVISAIVSVVLCWYLRKVSPQVVAMPEDEFEVNSIGGKG